MITLYNLELVLRIFQPQINRKIRIPQPGLAFKKNKKEYSKKGARGNNPASFNIRKKAEMPTRTTWLNIPVLSFRNFIKEIKSQGS